MFEYQDLQAGLFRHYCRNGISTEDKGTAVGYINALRKRAYGDELHQVSESWLSQNSFRNLMNERGRELYWEAVRRTDLVRFGLLTSSTYIWDFVKSQKVYSVNSDNKYAAMIYFKAAMVGFYINDNTIQKASLVMYYERKSE